MAIVPIANNPIVYRHAITLEEYARFIEYDECLFFGVNTGNQVFGACQDFWSLAERQTISRYLAEAQEEIEDEAGYLLQPTWVVGRLADQSQGLERYVDEKLFKRNCQVFDTRWNKIINIGIRRETFIANAAIDYTTEPAIIGPITTNPVAIDEIHVFYPNTELEINPSSIYFVGNDLYIEIPRCRLVSYDLLNETNLVFDNVANFQVTVDIKRIYNDTATKGIFYCDCDSVNVDLEIKNPRTGLLKIDNSCLNTCLGCDCKRLGLYYYCGEKKLSLKASEAIIRLAHSKMTDEPCGCDVVSRMWRRDKNIPDVMTSERAMCPFGINDGAWVAWQWAKTMKMPRLGIL